MEEQNKNIEEKNQEPSIWKKYFYGWNGIINFLIALVPASLAVAILREILLELRIGGILGSLSIVVTILFFVYIVGLIREKFSNRKDKVSVRENKTEQSKIDDNKTDKNNKRKWFIGIILIILTIIVISAINSSSYVNTDNKSTILYSDEVIIPGFTRYINTEKESGFKISILFPTIIVETNDLSLEEAYIKSYQSHRIFNEDEGEFARYSLHIVVPQVGKILSEESKRAYLTNYPESKMAPLDGILSKKEMTTFKGLMAVEYKYVYEMYGIKMSQKGISFIVDGIPIDLSVGYTNQTPESNIYYDNYIKSFAILQKN